jgi:hypothetical protein
MCYIDGRKNKYLGFRFCSTFSKQQWSTKQKSIMFQGRAVNVSGKRARAKPLLHFLFCNELDAAVSKSDSAASSGWISES